MVELVQPLFPQFARGLAAGLGDPIEHVKPGATAAQISDAEVRLGLPFPRSYRDLLACTSGFWLLGGAFQFHGLEAFLHDFPGLDELTPVQRQTVARKGGQWPPPSDGMLCFAEYFVEADGDQALFNVRQGLVHGEYDVVYYAHEAIPPSVRVLTHSFRDFVEELFTNRWWGDA